MNNGKVVSLDAQRQVILWEPAAVVLDGKQFFFKLNFTHFKIIRSGLHFRI